MKNMKMNDDFKETKIGLLPAEWKVVQLGEVLKPLDHKYRRISVKDTETYTLISVSLYAKGIRAKELIRGGALKTKIWFRVQQGDFLLLKIWGRRGSYGFLKKAIPNAIVSSDYPILSLDRSKADEDFLDLFLSQPVIWDKLAVGAKGATNRQRIHERQFITLVSLPLPSLPEQKRIAYILSKIQNTIEIQNKLIKSLQELKKP